MYFDNFPTIPYDSELTNEYKDVKNLLRRVGIRAKVKSICKFKSESSSSASSTV